MLDSSQIIYLQIAGKIWKRLPDGDLIPLESGEKLPPGAKLFYAAENQFSQLENGDVLLIKDATGKLLDEPLPVQFVVSLGESEALYREAKSGNILSTFFGVDRDGHETIARGGYETRDTRVENQRPVNKEIADDDDLGNIEISIIIVDGGDDYINRFETPVLDFFGNTRLVQDGTPITITVVDVNGLTLSFNTTVFESSWRIDDADLSALAEGEISATVLIDNTASSPTPVTATATTFKDTLAQAETLVLADGGDGQLSAAEIAAGVAANGSFSNVQSGAIVTLSITDSTGKTYTDTVTLDASGNWSHPAIDLSSLADGDLIFVASTIDQAGNPATITSTTVKDTQATISVNIDDGGDDYINASETAFVVVSGTVLNIEDGQTVTVTLSDDVNTQIFTTIVSAGNWSITGIDTSVFDEGRLTATADVVDLAGNPATALDTTVKDTLAAVTVSILDGGDAHLNNAEVSSLVSISGTVSNIEDGQNVSVTLTSAGGGAPVVVTGIVAGGIWQIDNVDISALADGLISAEASVTDVAGNPATALDNSTKDTQAAISIAIEDGGDELINDAEVIALINVSGSVTNVEDGQSVTLTLSDGVSTQILNTTIIGGNWTVNGIDVSAFNDGVLTATANVTDLAGNPAAAQDTSVKDTQAAISINILDGGDELINDTEISGLISLAGLLSHVEDGQTISVTLTSAGGGAPVVVNTVVSGNSWQLDNVDIRTLTDGLISANAVVVDVAGNPATAIDTSTKDTLASITVDMVDGGDGINNVEAMALTVQGTVSNVNDGQTITVILSSTAGGGPVTVTTVVSGGNWNIPNVDISSLGDGLIAAQASVNDVAGNVAPALDLSIKNTIAAIDVLIIDGGDELINAVEVGNLISVLGTTVDVIDGQVVTVTLTSANGGTPVVVNTTVSGGVWQIDNIDISGLGDGVITADSTVIDFFGNPAAAQDTSTKDTLSTITVDILDGGDGLLSGAEVTALISVSGSVNNVEDGEVVTVTLVSSGGGAPVNVNATVLGGVWQIDNIDISGLSDGQIIAYANVTDVAGNPATALDTSIKDSLASISVAIVDGGDEWINDAEVTALISVSGTVVDVDDGQIISVSLTSAGGGSPIIVNTVASGGSWQIDNIDVSALGDGVITADASVTDIAGNFATAMDSSTKDTQASISINILDGGDELLNTAEAALFSVSGAVSEIEDGQTVSVTLTSASGGVPVVVNGIVTGGIWQIDNIDIAALGDGLITAVASVTDQAGNPATAQDTSVKDSIVTIDFDTSVNTIDYEALRDGREVNLAMTTDAEDGQIITVSVDDATNTLSFTGTASSGTANITIPAAALSVLNSTVSWSMSAEVSDIAGNTAVDDLPTIILPDGAVLSEEGLSPGGEFPGVDVQDITDLVMLGVSDFTFNANQPDLLSLTSQSSALSMSISGGGKVLTISRVSDGLDVLQATINVGDTITTELLNAIDHALLLDILQTKILVDGSQNDAGGDTDIVTAPVVLSILDSTPRATDDTETSVEAAITSGNLLVNDNSPEQPLSLSMVNVGGDIRLLTTASPTTTYNLLEGALTINLDGSWSLVANSNLDHSGADPVINLTYQTLDNDGDSDTAVATITVTDGAAGIIADQTADISEGTITTTTLQAAAIFGTAGSDDLDASSIAFGATTLVGLNALSLTAGGELISYSLSSDGKTLTAQTASHIPVFTVVLSATANAGNIDVISDFTLSAPLDHNSSDTLILSMPLNALDNDGTPADEGEIQWSIHDGANPTAVAVAELALSEGLGLPQMGSSILDVAVGSDTVESLVFAASSLQPDVSSGGAAIIYAISPDGLTLTGHTGDVFDPAFTVELTGTLNSESNSSITYTMTLIKALDQLDSSGNSLTEETLPLVISLTDGDGDVVQTTLAIKTIDGNAPVVGGGALSVTEIPADPVAGIGLSNSANTLISVSAGDDPVVTMGFDVTTGDSVVDSNGNSVTQAGDALTWRDNANGTLDAITASGDIIFTATLPASLSIAPGAASNVSFSFNQLGAIDHLSSSSGQQQQLDINIPVIATDSDGTSATQHVTVTVVDGALPSLGASPAISGNEDDLLTGTINIAGSVSLIQGSDAIASIAPDIAAFNALGLTSAGLNITLTAPSTADGFWLANDSSGDEIFRVSFNTSGSVDFIQSRALDHPAAGTDNLDVVFQLIISDVDGDISNTASYTVTITDDVPNAPNIVFSVVEGATITSNLFTTDEAGADGASIKANSIIYRGVNYNPGDTITLVDTLAATTLGTLVINTDGSSTLVTVATAVGSFSLQDVAYTIIDGDGDEQDRTLDFDIDDEPGTISIIPSSTGEDNPLTLSLTATAGDIDNGEIITTVLFDIAALAGGTLELNGVELTINAGNYELSNLILTGGAEGEIAPNGTLVYIPAVDVSNFNVSPQFVTSTIVDITVGGTRTDVHAPIDISITSIADVPIWNDAASTYVYALNEDDPAVSLVLDANLKDSDGSELFSYRIENITADIILTLNGSTVNNGDIVNESQLNLIQAGVVNNAAGVHTFDVTAIATEQDNSDFAEVTKTISLNVTPVADTPTVSPRSVHGEEDVPIDLSTMISGQLLDLDGSETLSFQVDVPVGWTLTGSGVTTNGINSYLADANEVAAGNVMLVPAADISSVDNGGAFNITFTAIATESTQGGIAPVPPVAISAPQTVTVTLKGVADNPDISSAGNWSYNGIDTITNTGVNEDDLIALDFVVATTDDQNTEDITLNLRNLPDGVIFVNAGGVEQFVTVIGIDDGKPVYQTTLSELQTLSLKTTADFSGDISFNLNQINTEPDGDSQQFNITVNIPVIPVVDTINGQTITSNGLEDQPIVLNFNPVLLDVDGSETLTGIIINSIPAATSLLFDGSSIAVSPTGLDLASLLDATSPTLSDLISSGRLTLNPPTDVAGPFAIDTSMQITDDSGTGSTTVSTINVTLDAIAAPLVEVNTRLENDGSTQSANGGIAIDLTGRVEFFDEDNDGSEVIDYIVIIAPNATDWFISHPNGAIHDGGGRWLIPATGLTDDLTQEFPVDLLAGASITGSTITAPVNFIVQARVLDGSDAEMRNTNLSIEILSNAVSSIASDPDSLQLSVIDGQEGSAIATGGHLELSVINATDVGLNDNISYRVEAAGFDPRTTISISGVGVLSDYAADGKTVIAWVFSEAAVPGLIINIGDDDFAGTLDIPITVVATDPSGDTFSESQTLTVDVAPVVDGVTLESPTTTINEDTATTLNLNFSFDDSNEAGEGIESLDPAVTVILGTPDGGSLNASPTGILLDNMDGTWDVLDNSRINEIVFTPPANASGDFRVTATGSVIDTATLSTGLVTDTAAFSDSISITVEPVTDMVSITTADVSGDEDSDISLGSIVITPVDSDGSEQLTATLSGVPEGAIVLLSGVQQANNGQDGGSFLGQPTYIWSFPADQISNISIRPPLNFSGDIPLSLQVLTVEQGTTDIVSSASSFIVGVNPVADGSQIRDNPATVNANEGDVVSVQITSEALEVDGIIPANETLQLTVLVKNTSATSAVSGLDGIRVGVNVATFTDIGGGNFQAVLLVAASTLSDFELLPGADAFGDLEVTVGIASVDSNTVLGTVVTDTSVDSSYDLTITLDALPTEPMLQVPNESIIAAGANTPLNLSMSLVNPAAGETGLLSIANLPGTLTLNAGTNVAGTWQVDLADVASLAVLGGSGENFTLLLTPSSSLGGSTVSGTPISISMQTQSDGINTLAASLLDDLLTGGAGRDTFEFSAGTQGSVGAPSVDTITDFNATVSSGDVIDLTNLTGVAATGVALDNVIDISETGGNTTFHIKPNTSDITQEIILQGVALTDIVTGAGGMTEAQVLQQMLDDQQLMSN